MHPFTPHLSEEMWKCLDLKGLAINQFWPKPKKIYRKKTCNIAIQINGKTREIIVFDKGVNEDIVKTKALKNTKIKKVVDNKHIKRIVFVPDKILNIVLI